MQRQKHLIGALSLLMMCCSYEYSYSDLFDDARRSITVTPYQGDTSGMSIRGGANLQTGQTGNTTLFRTQASVGGSCGSFNFRASMTEAFETLPEVFEQLLANVIQEIPMLVL
jgi:hypothetical protein